MRSRNGLGTEQASRAASNLGPRRSAPVYFCRVLGLGLLLSALLSLTSCNRWAEQLERAATDQVAVYAATATPKPATGLAADLLAPDTPARFEHLSLEQGLSQSSVFCILQDSKGFLWVGTQDGLNKYDGYGFTVYRPVPDDDQSLSNSYILSMARVPAASRAAW
jgi:hypothetical protein